MIKSNYSLPAKNPQATPIPATRFPFSEYRVFFDKPQYLRYFWQQAGHIWPWEKPRFRILSKLKRLAKLIYVEIEGLADTNGLIDTFTEIL